ncbi:MAG: aspartate carbamoyltransferase regulatory subunit [Methanocalculus sp. MSAO_Arc1]|uniref:aspartate carbamoyltransferase regulatory subunit n=1 Tax=Methanocalculus TaxID=71151 RepID=UPI000FF7EF29|nr:MULTISPECIES: aspartate carbamoyltransferase regulatory subunit [unclassified Methanocalculus]MCP1663110.1 aspartate carbamoyltransferase regulatory subunit [Methanocalculus sp. AMF5]RQD81574.1 MAG: aspartate carbamoyltransferase regulatory subunit [Methanocalculus sp. MSAO_Arc1]
MKGKPEDGLLISPIRNGTVIDHIAAGEGLPVLRILGITGRTTEELSVATNVESRQMGKKDIVKIENRELVKEEVDRISLIAPKASINIIREYRVVQKIGVEIPSEVVGVIRCPNPACISNANEPIRSLFACQRRGYRCRYCDTMITRDVGSYIV